MTTVDSDAQLAAAGDMEAFEKIYRRYHHRVYCLCLRMTRSVSEAEDLAQDVFVQLFRKIGTFRGEASFATWLHRLTVNQVLMHFRKPAVRKEQTSEDSSTPIQAAAGTENPAKMSLLDRLSLDEAMGQLARQVIARYSFSTMSKGTSTNRLGGCSDVPLELRSRSCIKLE